MWILHICHSYYPPFLDCARQYNALFKGTAYKVLTVYLTGKPDADVARDTCSDEVIFLGYKSKQVSGLKLGAIAKVKKIAKEKDFLFCIAHRVKPTYVALLATILPIVSVHHNYNDYTRWSRKPLVNYYQNRLLMLGVSDAVRDDLRRDLKGWDAERIQTLYNHIDIAVTQDGMQTKAEARLALNLPPNAYVVGNVGRLHHDKDQATLINGFHQALPRLPESSILYIAGKGPLEAALKQQINALALNERVILAGNIPDAKRYFKAFDVFALTSDREPFGMVLLEAMAADLAMICSDCGGGAEIVKEIGQLFEYGNAKALADCLVKQSNQYVDAVDMLEPLANRFSDEAIREQFWNIDIVQAYSKGDAVAK